MKIDKMKKLNIFEKLLVFFNLVKIPEPDIQLNYDHYEFLFDNVEQLNKNVFRVAAFKKYIEKENEIEYVMKRGKHYYSIALTNKDETNKKYYIP